VAYLKARIKNVDEQDRIVVLMGDEIHCAERVEYSGGKLFGHQEGTACKTLLCFMVKSIRGHYSDTVSLIPTNKLDSSKVEIRS